MPTSELMSQRVRSGILSRSSVPTFRTALHQTHMARSLRMWAEGCLGPFGAIIEWYEHRRQHASLASRLWVVG